MVLKGCKGNINLKSIMRFILINELGLRLIHDIDKSWRTLSPVHLLLEGWPEMLKLENLQ